MVQCVRHGKRPPVVQVWPDMPSRRAALYKITRQLGWELTNLKRTDAVLGIRFQDRTHKDTSAIPIEMWLASPWWNVDCNDISKGTLEEAHKAAFGYGMRLDPTTHEGPLVMKSDENAQHDGALITGPIVPDQVRENVVYQREIDNCDDKGDYYDYRVVCVQKTFPVVYKKYKDAARRFTNETVRVELLERSPFSVQEEDCMRQLAQGMNIDYGEFDALRDRTTGQLYVVDVNPTPWGPPAQLAPELQTEAVKRVDSVLASLCVYVCACACCVQYVCDCVCLCVSHAYR